MRSVVILVVLALGLWAGVAAAQQAAPGAEAAKSSAEGAGLVKPFAALAAGLGMAIAAGLCGLGQGRAAAAAVEAMARQPGLSGAIRTAMIIGLALIESLAIYMLLVAIILLFVRPGLTL